MLTKTIFTLALMALVLAEKPTTDPKTEAEKPTETKKDKRGTWGLGYGYNSLGFDSGLGVATYAAGAPYTAGISSFPATYSVGHNVNTVITKEVGVPVPHPVAVPVDRPVPYAVKVPYAVPVDRPYPVHVPKPYPVEVTKHVAVPVDRPVPVPVSVPVKVPVPAPYAVHVPQPYAVPVVKHVPYPVSQPIVVDRYSADLSHGWSGFTGPTTYTSW